MARLQVSESAWVIAMVREIAMRRRIAAGFCPGVQVQSSVVGKA
jgi:hypothetical protein